MIDQTLEEKSFTLSFSPGARGKRKSLVEEKRDRLQTCSVMLGRGICEEDTRTLSDTSLLLYLLFDRLNVDRSAARRRTLKPNSISLRLLVVSLRLTRV